MKLILFVFFVFLSQCYGANILALFPMPTKSHLILGTALVNGLVAKGHNVTFVTAYKVNDSPNIKNIELSGPHVVMEEYKDALGSVYNTTMLETTIKLNGLTDKMTEVVLADEKIKQLLQSDSKFDLVIFEAVMNEAHFAIAHHFSAPFVVLSTVGSQPSNHITGNLAPYSFVPNLMLGYSDKMNFAERLTNTALGIIYNLAVNFKLYPAQEQIYRKYFGDDGPELQEIIKNVSLVLLNTHVVLETPRPYLPNMIPVGGFHIEEPKKLPKYLQEYLDNAKEGVIYFSLGSNLRSADLPDEKRNIFLNTFKKLPYRVLWKFEEENLPGKPDNVKISKWFPQNDVLAHPNVKLFISHGGMLSSTEAVYGGVPLIGIPFYGDQKANTLNFVSSGYGLYNDFGTMTEESFTEIINEAMNNPKYRENVKRRSQIIQDQLEKPLDRAVFWIEHILRCKGGEHLRSAVLDLSLAQYLLLDVLAFATFIVGTFIVGLVLLCKILCSRKTKTKTE